MQAVLSAFQRFSAIGTEGRSEEERRAIQTTNISAALVLLVVLSYDAFYLLYDAAALWPLILANLGYGALYVTVPLINGLGRRRLAICVFMLVAFANIGTATYFLGTAAGIQLYYMNTAGLCTLMTLADERLDSAVYILGSALLFLLAMLNFDVGAIQVFPDWLLQGLFAGSTLGVVMLITLPSFIYRRLALDAEAQLGEANARNEELLHNILPEPIAERLRTESLDVVADRHDATVVFADIAGFSRFASHRRPETVVKLLNEVFSRFDDLCDRHGVEKIKTIGDGYMAAAGLPEPDPQHAQKAANLALAMVEALKRYNAERGDDVEMRIGLHSGPLVAGVIGKRKFTYDLWGDTVNVASRLEATGERSRIQVSANTRALLKDGYRFEPRGEVDLRGIGAQTTYYLTSPAGATALA